MNMHGLPEGSFDPTLSVVVPVYNVEEFLGECIESIALSTLTDIEVILIDDGSTDGSAAIAEEWVERDPRLQLFQQENRGLGAARNAGASLASGTYLAFLDSDDRVPPEAYARMVATLEQTGSDFVTGNVHRFNAKRSWQAPMYKGVCDKTRLRTHVSRDRELLKDLLAHNKVWRRSFWDGAQLSFREGVLYEDLPTTIPAHVKAKSVDVLSDVVDLWRMRESDQASITQSKASDVRQARDRINAATYVSSIMALDPDPTLKEDYDFSVLERDIRYFIDVFPDVDVDYFTEALSLINHFLDRAAPGALGRVTSQNRIKYELIRRGERQALLDYIEMQRSRDLQRQPYIASSGRVLLDLSRSALASLDISAEARDVTPELHLVTRVTDVSLGRDELLVEGWAYIDRLAVATEDDLQISVWAQSQRGGGRLPMQVVRHLDPEATREANQPHNSYDWARFEARLTMRQLQKRKGWKLRRHWTRGKWHVVVGVTALGMDRLEAPLQRPHHGRAERTSFRSLTGENRLRVGWSKDSLLTILLHRAPPTAKWVNVDREFVDIRLALPAPSTKESRLVLRHTTENYQLSYPLDGETTESAAVRVLAPTYDLRLAEDQAGGVFGQLAPSSDWEVMYRKHDGAKLNRVAVSEDFSARSHVFENRETAARPSRYGNLRFLERPERPRLRTVRWGENATLCLEMSYASDLKVEAVVFSALGRSEQVAIPVAIREGGKIELAIPLAAIETFGQSAPLRAGLWQLSLRTAVASLPLELDRGLISSLPIDTEHRGRQYRIGDRKWHRPYLRIGSELAADEAGTYHQERLRSKVYPELRGATDDLRKAVLYDCYLGKEFADSPRAIFDELVSRNLDLEHLVLVRDQQFTVPHPAKAIAIWSKEFYAALAQSRFVVSNTHLPPYFRKVPGQTVVQTWHGIGLKHVGLDIESVGFMNRSYLHNIRTEADNTDFVISPNPFNSPIIARAFAVKGTLLETGVPRNDIFFAKERANVIEETKEEIGISARDRVVLYAPTWRDNIHAGGKYRLDLRVDFETLSEQLGEGYKILFRKHSNIVDKLPEATTPHAIDVSDHPDIQRLLMITDILVTDYSTLMFDFAITGRPMVFYTYDLDHYRNVLRGFYFDLEKDAPGPLVANQADLTSVLLNIDNVARDYADTYLKFEQRFCPWDDGKAAQRVVDAVFSGSEVGIRRNGRTTSVVSPSTERSHAVGSIVDRSISDQQVNS